jgi:hypothetical protein
VSLSFLFALHLYPWPKNRDPKPKRKLASLNPEFVASTCFRSSAYVQPIWKGVRFESDYFGGDEIDAGYNRLAWEFRLRELRFKGGFGAALGGNSFRTFPAFEGLMTHSSQSRRY